jgi:hypothetical protein
MLRIATSVKAKDGTRAIGTYIPALKDGKPNPVVETVLKGQVYVGRAFVVNAWYVTNYTPFKDETGKDSHRGWNEIRYEAIFDVERH